MGCRALISPGHSLRRSGRVLDRRRTFEAIRWVTELSIRWLHLAPKAVASFHQSKLQYEIVEEGEKQRTQHRVETEQRKETQDGPHVSGRTLRGMTPEKATLTPVRTFALRRSMISLTSGGLVGRRTFLGAE